MGGLRSKYVEFLR